VDEAFFRRLAQHADLPFASDAEISGVPLGTLPAAAARTYSVVPLADDGATLVVATPDPGAVDVEALSVLTERSVSLVVASADAVARELERVAPPSEPPEPRQLSDPSSPLERERFRRLADHAGLRYAELDDAYAVSQELTGLLGPDACVALRFVPLGLEDERLLVATDELNAGLGVAIAEGLTGLGITLAVAATGDVDRKLDRLFGRHAPEPASEHRLLGELLVAAGEITQTELAEALAYQERTGDRLGQVLLSMGLVRERSLARAYAEQVALPDLDVAEFEPDDSVLRVVPESVARTHRFAPLAIRDHVLYVAVAEAMADDALADLREHTDLPVRTVVAPKTSIEQLLRRVYRDLHVEVASIELLNRTPEESAFRVVTHAQKLVLVVLVALAALFFFAWPLQALIFFTVSSILFYSTVSLYKLRLIYRALQHQLELPVSREEIEALDPHELPKYTILVPLYREAAVIEHLVTSVGRLDYPATKLDVKLLVEEDDLETRERIEELGLPAQFKLVVVPDSKPKTKPKACNYGLIQAEGKYVVIYDAEDRPDPDQLKKIVAAFARVEERIVCIQCKLNYFNRTQNVLTRWFTAEYSHWFDLLMPGLDAADAPIPLGGTSNHFITEKLIELGAWDPFNVTEDADLGIRLHKAGYKTGMVDSTTFEEANSDLYNWIRQRSRWVKGYIQTWLVHMRHPVRLHRQIGWRSFWSFQFIIAGTFLSFLLNPFYWTMTTLWLMTQFHVIQQIFPFYVYYPAAIALFIGNFGFTYINVAGCMRRGHAGLVKYALLSPIYWALMSVGAWKGLIQLVYRPHYWEKTVHGLDIGVVPEYVHGTSVGS